MGRLGLKKKNRKTLLIGGFHSLADSIDDVPYLLKKNYKNKIRESLKGLDHIFFFGNADKQKSIELFDIPRLKHFWVYTLVWSFNKLKYIIIGLILLF